MTVCVSASMCVRVRGEERRGEEGRGERREKREREREREEQLMELLSAGLAYPSTMIANEQFHAISFCAQFLLVFLFSLTKKGFKVAWS